MELENHLNALEETSVIQLELGKEFGGTELHLEVELESVSITMVVATVSVNKRCSVYRAQFTHSCM